MLFSATAPAPPMATPAPLLLPATLTETATVKHQTSASDDAVSATLSAVTVELSIAAVTSLSTSLRPRVIPIERATADPVPLAAMAMAPLGATE